MWCLWRLGSRCRRPEWQQTDGPEGTARPSTVFLLGSNVSFEDVEETLTPPHDAHMAELGFASHTLDPFVKSVKAGNRVLPNLSELKIKLGRGCGVCWQTKKDGYKQPSPCCGLLCTGRA